MIIAKQSTAQIVTVGPVLDADGVAVTDGVVGDFKISKNGGAPAALNGSATLTHRNTGFYSLSLTATDLNTVGTVEIVIDDTTNCCPMKEIQVVETAIYDALYADAATGLLPANVTQWNGSNVATPTVAGVPEVDVTHFGGSVATASGGRPEVNVSHWAGGTNEITNFSTVFDDDFASNYDTDNDCWAVVIGNTTGIILRNQDAYEEWLSLLRDADGMHLLTTTIATIPSQTSFTLAGGSTDDDAYNDCEIVVHDTNGGANDICVGVILDYVGSTKTVTLLQDPGIYEMEVGDTVHIRASRALKATAHNRRLIVDTAGIAQSQLAADVQHGGGSSSLVMDTIQVNDSLTLAPTTIDQLTVTNATTLSGIVSATNASNDIRVNLTKILGENALAARDGTLRVAVDSWYDLDGAVLADLVLTSNRPEVATASIVTAVWAAATRTLTALDEDSTTLDLDATIRAAIGLSAANLDTQLGDLPTNAELATALAAADDAVLAAIAALNNLSAAQVNAEVLDVLAVDTFAQPGQESPAATQTLKNMLAYLYKAWRNKKTQTSSEFALYADDGTTKDQEAAVSDDGTTLQVAEMQTGA